MGNKRIYWLDTLKFICICFVIMSHTYYCNNYIRVLYAPFFLSSFFLISGMFFNNEDDFKTLIFKKARTIIIPWLVIGLISIIARLFLTFNDNLNVLNDLYCMFIHIRGYNDFGWFLPCLFMCFIPLYFYTKIHFSLSPDPTSIDRDRLIYFTTNKFK